MNFNEAVNKACEQPTLVDALSWIALWECERVIPTAHKFLNGEKPPAPDGKGWETCFKFLIKQVIIKYTEKS